MFKGILAIVGAFLLIKYRVKVVDTTGKFGWCEKYLGPGGTYHFMIVFAIILFIWGVAKATGTDDVLLGPLANFFDPGGGGGEVKSEWDF
ncbi:hypothetical protein HOF17_02120 [Candidatus Peribacteria bacterium]|jgi:hypothetical protein|nr:hypothetical protein [Candidatus Peribacteria bacterium]